MSNTPYDLYPSCNILNTGLVRSGILGQCANTMYRLLHGKVEVTSILESCMFMANRRPA